MKGVANKYLFCASLIRRIYLSKLSLFFLLWSLMLQGWSERKTRPSNSSNKNIFENLFFTLPSSKKKVIFVFFHDFYLLQNSAVSSHRCLYYNTDRISLKLLDFKHVEFIKVIKLYCVSVVRKITLSLHLHEYKRLFKKIDQILISDFVQSRLVS